MSENIQAADLFCGAGGSSEGLVEAGLELGREVDLVAVNHNPLAVETHTRNHPDARHYLQDVRVVKPKDAVPSGHLDILLAGAPCPQHSLGRGARPMDEQERSLPREIHKWHEDLDVDAMLIENVPRFQLWGPLHKSGRRKNKPIDGQKGEYFEEFIARIRQSGFKVEWRTLNTANFGAGTSRTRLFIMARKEGEIRWPVETHSEESWKPASDIIDWSLKGTSIFRRKKPLAEATMSRIMRGFKVYGKNTALISKYYGSGIAKPVSLALDTITTRDRFLLVEPVIRSRRRDVLIRMLQPHELSRAMGFRSTYEFSGGRADKIMQLGNAWECVTAKKLCLAALAS
jgi:DNA (cytosine-5)-methyltransferase 1